MDYLHLLRIHSNKYRRQMHARSYRPSIPLCESSRTLYHVEKTHLYIVLFVRRSSRKNLPVHTSWKNQTHTPHRSLLSSLSHLPIIDGENKSTYLELGHSTGNRLLIRLLHYDNKQNVGDITASGVARVRHLPILRSFKACICRKKKIPCRTSLFNGREKGPFWN